MIKSIDGKQVEALMESEATCILNIVTAWCGDCTKQAESINLFASHFIVKGISVYEVNVQNERNQFLSPELAALTDSLGGPGYPRTVLIQNGKVVDADNVEVISKEQLAALADKFQQQLHFS